MSRIFAIAALCAAIVSCHTAPNEMDERPLEIRALDWISSDTDPVEHLTTQPASCLAAGNDPAMRRGELLFNSPLLLGGQAGKAGLSCAACHRNGRGNPDFVFNGISGRPGTADVTNGLFSSVRADKTFNPVLIPDLASLEGRMQVDRTHGKDLEDFLTAQIVEEFSGPPPNESMVADLAAYIRALDTETCADLVDQRQSWQDEANRIDAGLEAIEILPRQEAYVSAIRAGLGRLNNRYQGPEFGPLRAELVKFSRDLASEHSFSDLSAHWQQIRVSLADGEAQSLYSRDQLERVLR